jgi:hypothetical protein
MVRKSAGGGLVMQGMRWVLLIGAIALLAWLGALVWSQYGFEGL